MMSLPVFISNLLISALLIHRGGDCGNVRIDRLDKTLFKPSISYPAFVHLQPARYHSEILENEAAFPRYAYDFNDYTDTLQKQVPFQMFEKRLESLLQIGDETKHQHAKTVDVDDENYDKRANNVAQPNDESKFEFEELDRRFKRGQAELPAAPAPSFLRSITKERLPFGPYTTWEPVSGNAEILRRASHQHRLIGIEPDRNTKKSGGEFASIAYVR